MSDEYNPKKDTPLYKNWIFLGRKPLYYTQDRIVNREDAIVVIESQLSHLREYDKWMKGNIETLRQKLIEQLKKDAEVFDREYLIAHAIEDRINKLFGI